MPFPSIFLLHCDADAGFAGLARSLLQTHELPAQETASVGAPSAEAAAWIVILSEAARASRELLAAYEALRALAARRPDCRLAVLALPGAMPRPAAGEGEWFPLPEATAAALQTVLPSLLPALHILPLTQPAAALRRLPAELRELSQGLAVFHGGGHLGIIAKVLGTHLENALRLVMALINAGLAENLGHGHVRLHPMLLAAPARPSDFVAACRARWVEGMTQLLEVIYEQHFQDAHYAAQLASLELPNFMGLSRYRLEQQQAGHAAPETVLQLAALLEAVLSEPRHSDAVAVIVAARAGIPEIDCAWSHLRYLRAASRIGACLGRNEVSDAGQLSAELLDECSRAGLAYPQAAYDHAHSQWLRGHVLRLQDQPEAALPVLAAAERGFAQIAAIGERGSFRMVAVAMGESGDCWRALGKLEPAAKSYEEAIRHAERADDRRQAAIHKGQLGTVRLSQQQHGEALKLYREALDRFETLGEMGMVALLWQQIGLVFRQARQFSDAEDAYRRALALRTQQNMRQDQAASLGELGSLYADMGRLQESADLYRQALEVSRECRDARHESAMRSNLADKLARLEQFTEAREQALLALESGKAFGHAAQPWKTWMILHQAELASGNPLAAADARRQAVNSYLAYRRDGGKTYSGAGQLCAFTLQSLRHGKRQRVTHILQKLADQPEARRMVEKVQAVVNGDYNPRLADDPELFYDDAAELQLLMENLAPPPSPGNIFSRWWRRLLG
jgi:tetratricopeptide (TPR) repeat protein